MVANFVELSSVVKIKMLLKHFGNIFPLLMIPMSNTQNISDSDLRNVKITSYKGKLYAYNVFPILSDLGKMNLSGIH